MYMRFLLIATGFPLVQCTHSLIYVQERVIIQ